MSQQINSTFEITNWPFLKNAYNNVIRDQIINENATIKIIGNHLNGYSNKDVNAISFIGCKFSKFPQQLTAVFPNIEAIYIYQSNMPYILREDLKEYKKVKQFYIEDNKIIFLQQDLLADMKSLEIFYVHENNLLYVEPEIFDNLGNIRYINFDQCSIHNFTFNTDGSKDCKTLKEVKKKLQEKHQNSPWKRYCDEQKKLLKDSESFENFKVIMQNEKLKDFKVFVDADKFNAHKFVLAARSPVFAEMIENNPDAESLNLVDISPDIFHEIYNFMYTNEFPKTESVNLIHLLIASEKLKIKKLADFAANELTSKITNENAFELMSLGKKYNYEKLMKNSFEKIKKLFDGEQIDEGLVNKPEKLKKLLDLKMEKIRYLNELEEKFKSVLNEE